MPDHNMDHALCLGCNYPLRGLESARCPECGRGFEAGNSRTFNTGRPIGAVTRWLLEPIGWPTIVMAAVGLGLILWVTPVPRSFRISAAEWHYYRSVYTPNRLGRSWALSDPDRAFLGGVALSFVAACAYAACRFGHLAVLLTRRSARPLHQRHAVRHVLLLASLMLSGCLVLFGWPGRLVPVLCQHILIRSYIDCDILRTASDEEILLILSTGVSDFREPRMRTAALKGLVERSHGHALPTLLRLFASERDPAMRLTLMRLIALCRDPRAAAVIDPLLRDPDPAVRAAAADALGALHCPAYVSSFSAQLDTDPPIEIAELLGEPDLAAREWDYGRKPMSEARQQSLREMVQHAPTLGEREAAARAVMPFPPADAHFRYAEWGVWLTQPSGDMKGMDWLLGDVPPFVHRTGNPTSEFRGRFCHPLFGVGKPVIYLRATVPIAADIRVVFCNGRPWVAYPRPDDYALQSSGVLQSSSVACANWAERMARLADPNARPLGDLWQGYPWMLPRHPRHEVIPWGGWTPGGSVDGLIESMGVRWQSVVVTPERQPCMKPPDVPDDRKYQWWSRLRNVPASWVSNRGETERFLYYDGSTSMQAPMLVRRVGAKLRFTDNKKLGGAFSLLNIPRDFIGCGMHVLVQNDQASGEVHPLWQRTEEEESHLVEQTEYNGGGWEVAGTFPLEYHDAEVRHQFQLLLMKYGLSKDESQALIDCWDDRFFKTPGQRYLMILPKDYYDIFCPLQVRPEPNELVRVGVVLTEFGDAPIK